jgi:general secretion pathway protein I
MKRELPFSVVDSFESLGRRLRRSGFTRLWGRRRRPGSVPDRQWSMVGHKPLLMLHRRAFTLVEVLVSLGIFALAAVVLGTAYVNVLLNFHNMQRRTAEKSEMAFARAALLAEPVRARAEEGGEVPLPEGGRLRWSATLEETTVADLFQVNLAMEIAAGGPAPLRREKQAFLVLRPTWSDPEKREKLRAAARERLAKIRS